MIENQTFEWVLGGKNYHVDKIQLGKGNYGSVYKAYDETQRQIIAIKKIDINHSKNQIDALKKLNSPSIIQYIDSYADQKQEICYIMMEYFQGITLNQRIKHCAKQAQKMDMSQKGLPQEYVLQILSQILQALQHMHDKGINHCDIKPENILVNDERIVKIIDLGQASTLQALSLGTPCYCPPEYFSKVKLNDYGPARDIWSLGLVIYEMLQGQHLFKQLFEAKYAKQQIENFGRKLRNYCQKGFQIKLSEQHHHQKIWQQILRDSLKFNPKSRCSVCEIKIKLSSQILYKYIQQTNGPQYGNFFSQLLKTPKNYPGQHKNPQQILRSQKIVNKVIKYLKFFYRKYQFLPKFCQLISEYKRFPFIPSSWKYVLIFLVLSLYTTSIKSLLNKIKNNTIRIDFQFGHNPDIDFSCFTKLDQNFLSEYFQIYIKFYDLQFQNYRARIDNKIIPKLIQRQQQLNKLQDGLNIRLKNLIDDTKSETGISRERILNFFRDFHQKKVQFKKDHYKSYFYGIDLGIVFMMKMIDHFDDFFENSQIASLDDMQKLSNLIYSINPNQENTNSNQRDFFLNKIIGRKKKKYN